MSVDIGATILGNQSQNNATDTNARNVRNTNIANLMMALMSRGLPLDAQTAHRLGLPASMVGQSSSILPYYMSDIEKNLGMNAGELVKTMQNISPQAEMDQYQSELDRSQPAFDSGTQFARDVTSGAESDKMIAEGQPVADARMGVATGKRNAALESLSQTLNDIDAIQSKKGFSGDSMGNRMMKFSARRNINSAAATDVNQAAFENAAQKAGLQQQARSFRLSNIGAADSATAAAIQRRGLPTSAAASRFQSSMSPLSFFNLGPHTYAPFQNPPTVGPNPSIAQLLGEGASGTGNSLANYFSKMKFGQNGSSSSGNTYNTGWQPAAGSVDSSNYPAGYDVSSDSYSAPPVDYSGG